MTPSTFSSCKNPLPSQPPPPYRKLTSKTSGDSYSTVGFWPGGDQPSASSPLGNPALPGTTTSGGLNWVGQVTSTLNTTLTLTWDFAVSGATTDKDIVDSYASACVDDQVDQFDQYLSGKPPGDDSLVVFWTGINDVGESFWDGTAAPIEKVMDRYFELLTHLFDAGVKKFVLFTVPRMSFLGPFPLSPPFFFFCIGARQQSKQSS